MYFHSEDPYIFFGYKQNSITSSYLRQKNNWNDFFLNCTIHLFYILLLQDAMKGNKDECYCNWLLKVPNFCLCGHEWAWPTQRETKRRRKKGFVAIGDRMSLRFPPTHTTAHRCILIKSRPVNVAKFRPPMLLLHLLISDHPGAHCKYIRPYFDGITAYHRTSTIFRLWSHYSHQYTVPKLSSTR